MVIVKTWLPRYSNVVSLSRLSAPVSVCDYIGSRGHPTGIKLVHSNDEKTYVDAAYADVRRKFECYFVVLAPPSERTLTWKEIDKVHYFGSIRLLIGFEWQRTARVGELSTLYTGTTVGDMSSRQEIPDNTEALGIFVHGFAFWNDLDDQPVAAIVASHAVPGTLEILSERKDLDAIVAICDVVGIPELDSWTSDLQAWLAQKFGA
ncbi:MAG: hypothetical protein R3D51_17830 [Hyphomicrobiaceae bacterium]